ncbi:MAG TPA: threonine synthase [Acidimicrobiia bacterium]|jgi:threonine synthase|nr:threonine synthase [Acidimicrobiia bacterium]
MRYRSTRDAGPALAGFGELLLGGTAPDGGLYVPESWPQVDAAGLAGRSYAEVVAVMVAPFAAPFFTPEEVEAMAESSYRGFRHPDVAPLEQLAADDWLLDLTWGPTLSFKDYAMALLGAMMEAALERSGERVLVLGATSGDTGSAAIEALRGRSHVDVVIFYPEGRVSEIQRRQMTTVEERNVHAVAIEGTFDDCQDLVKVLLADHELLPKHRLAGFNSINWARVAPQTAFAAWATTCLGIPPGGMVFSVPTGNFGNIYAAYAATRMGIPTSRLVVGSNRNHGVTDLISDGRMTVEPVVPTLAPAMDIQVPSNMERLLTELLGGPGTPVAEAVRRLRTDGSFDLPGDALARLRELFSAAWLDDEATSATIAEVHRETGRLVDPHTAIGIAAGRQSRAPGTTLVSLATAHPAKFPEAVLAATGIEPELPAELAGIVERTERHDLLPARLEAVRGFVSEAVSEPE